MRAVVQRVSRAAVRVDGREVAAIGIGILALVAVTHTDGPDQARALARKLAALRILRGERSLLDPPASEILIVSQFTLYGDARKGRRPSWSAAAPAALAEPLVATLARELDVLGIPTATGVFGADMAVDLVNDGPFTVLLDV